jgi:hypothetical protein
MRRRQHHGGFLGSFGQHLKQELGPDFCQRHVSYLVDGDRSGQGRAGFARRSGSLTARTVLKRW